METIVECCAFGPEDLAAGQYIYFLQRWEEELEGAAKQVCGNGIGGLEGYDMSSPPRVSDKGLGMAKRPGQQWVVGAVGHCLS